MQNFPLMSEKVLSSSIMSLTSYKTIHLKIYYVHVFLYDYMGMEKHLKRHMPGSQYWFPVFALFCFESSYRRGEEN